MDLEAGLCYAASMSHAVSNRFFLQSLGCKVNQYECRALAEAWGRAGLTPCETPETAGLVVLCTCTVTARAEAESRRLTRRLVREAAPGARVVVTGCAASVNPAAFAALGAIPAPDKAALARHPFDPPQTPAGTEYPALAVSGHDRARALLKIQDGCSHRCSYCIVPTARGGSRSRPLEAVLAEAQRLVRAGHAELGLTGINLGHFGRDLQPAATFWDLVRDLEAFLLPRFGEAVRLRLGSLDPSMLTEDGAAILMQSRLVCPHLHISLQNADPGILTAMGRRPGDAKAVSRFVDAMRRKWPHAGLGFDIMAGFPGETEEAFAATAAFLREQPLTYAHIFPYSRRPGTPAAAMANQVPRDVKTERAARLRAIAREKKDRFLDVLVRENAPLVVALERLQPAAGTSQLYVDCRLTDEPAGLPGTLVATRAMGRDGDMLLVRPDMEPHAL